MSHIDPELTAKIETYRQLARSLGRPVGGKATVVKDVIKKAPKVAEKIVREEKIEEIEAEYDPVKEEIEKNQRRLREDEIKQAVREQSFRAFLEDTITSAITPVPTVRTPKAQIRSKSAHTRYPLLNLNDLHFEEIVKAEGVLGLNSYDIPTACRRLYRVVQSAIAWKRDAEAAGRFTFPELTVGLLGDMVTGALHGLERHSSAPNVVRAAIACGDLIALAIADLAAEFPKIKIHGVVGNHGRLPDDRKVPTKDPTRSFDYIAYSVAKRRLAYLDNVEWYLPEAYGVLFEVGGHQCYAAHGNFIPQSLGIVGYGLRRFTSSLAANLAAAGKPLKYAFYAHFHQTNVSEFAGVKAFISPALCGTQEYSFLSGGNVNRPAQEMYVFDPDLGHTETIVLYGDGPGYDGGSYALEEF